MVAVPEARNPTALSLPPKVVVPDPKLYMPLAADVDKLAPPALAVVVPAEVKVPTVRTAASASARKSVGRVEAVVAVAGTPMPSKFCVYAVDVDREIAANTTHTHINAKTEIETPINQDLVKGRFEVI